VAVAVLLLAAATGAAPAGAQTQGTLPGPSPLNRAVRSAVFPAWGQLTNGKEKKAAILFGIEAYVWTRVITETRKSTESERRLDRLEAEGATAFEISRAEASLEDHRRTRRDMLFWVILGGFYGALDAYIDANLGDFDEDLEEDRGLFAGVDAGARQVELGYRF